MCVSVVSLIIYRVYNAYSVINHVMNCSYICCSLDVSTSSIRRKCIAYHKMFPLILLLINDYDYLLMELQVAIFL